MITSEQRFQEENVNKNRMVESHPKDIHDVATLILAGGIGKRLFPLTMARCKPAISFGGRFRIIDIAMSNALNSGCNKIYILSQFLSASLHHHILKTYRIENFLQGFVELLSAEQKPSKNNWYQGTADAVRQSVDYIKEAPVDYFLILSGDQLYNMNFQNMLDFAKEKDADLVVSVLPIETSKAKRMGILKIDQDFKITDFLEKPEHPAESFRHNLPEFETLNRPYLGSMGIYLFKREVLFKLLEEDPREDFGKHLIPTQVKKGGVYAFVHKDYWEDIGTIESFYQANIDLTKPNPEFDCYNEKYPIYCSNHYLPGPRLFDTHVVNSLISEGAVIHAKEIKNSIIGPRAMIGKGCQIEDSYLIGNDYYFSPAKTDHLPTKFIIGDHCIIKKTIVDTNVQIGNNVQLLNKNRLENYDGKGIFIRDGIIVVARGTTLPNNFSL